MKQTNKCFLFSNFKDELSKHTTKNELTIQTSLNITAENNILEPTNGFVPLVEKVLKKDKIETFFKLNENLLNHLIWIGLYEYYNQETDSFCLRMFAISQGLFLYEYNFSTSIFDDTDIQFYNKPDIFTSNNTLVFNSANDKMVVVSNSNEPTTSSSSINYYCTDSNKIIFSKTNEKFNVYISSNSVQEVLSDEILLTSFEFNPDDGVVLDAIKLDDAIFVFQQYKISKLSLSNNTYKLSSVVSVSSKINANTICKIDDKIVFCSNNIYY